MVQEKLGRFMKEVNITYCSCGKYLDKNKWKPYKNIKELVTKKVRQRYPQAELSFEEFEFPDKPKEEVKNEIIVMVKDKEHVVDINLKLANCHLCEKEGTEYYEAILQVRSSNLDMLENSVELLKKRIENLRHKGMFINKIKRAPEGYDLFVTNKRIAQSLGRELYETYGGVFKASPHHYSRDRQTSKNLYRINVFVRLPGFVKADIIVSKHDKVFRVEKLGKKIKLLDLENNSFVDVDYSKLSYHILKKHSTYISRIYPHLEVINPLDYQSSMVKNKPDYTMEIGQEVNVVVHKGIYVVY